MTTGNERDRNTKEMFVHKKKIAQLLKIVSTLEELLQNIQKNSIDSFLDLLKHKFNVILTDSRVNNLLNDVTSESSIFHSDLSHSEKYNFSSIYLADILKRYIELGQETSNESNGLNELNGIVTNNDLVCDISWPGVMNRIDSYLDQRMKIKVDLKHITSEDMAMVEHVSDECVQIIISDMFKKK